MKEKRFVAIISFCCLLSFPFMEGCEKDDFVVISGQTEDKEMELFATDAANQVIGAVYEMLLQKGRNGKIIAVDFDKEENKCQLVFDDGASVSVLLSEVPLQNGFPDISVEIKDGDYSWVINDEKGKKSSKYSILRYDGICPQVKYENGVWWYKVEKSKWHQVHTSETQTMSICPFSSAECVSVIFSTGCQVDIEWADKVVMVCRNVPNRSFYKDIFLDAGYGLTNRTNLPAATYLGLSMDYLSVSQASDTILQNCVLGGEPVDNNGRLLYPDGQPRYKVLFVVGGNSRTHGGSLRCQTRERMRSFYYNGGSYVGTCAGAAFASNGYNNNDNYPYYLHLWPYSHVSPGVLNSSVGMRIMPNSPLLNYYNYGGDNLVASIRHNKGNYVDKWPAGAEILAWNDSTSDSLLQNKPAIWSYKYNNNSGRLVVTGSHPESYTSGERRDLMAAMIQYAIDGRGRAIIKGILRNGEAREMNKSAEDNNPYYTKIGDLQYHHYVVYIPKGAGNITFSVMGNSQCDMQLMLSNRTVPYIDNANYLASMPGSNQSLQFSSLEPGLWYVSVRCNTTVDAIDEEWGQVYSGRTDVLNGVPYSILVSWDVFSNHE